MSYFGCDLMQKKLLNAQDVCHDVGHKINELLYERKREREKLPLITNSSIMKQLKC